MSPRNRIIIFLTVLVGAVLLLTLLFGRPFAKKDSTPPATADKGLELVDYASRDSKVVFTIEGPIINQIEHRSIRITADSLQTKLEVIQGYNGNVIQTNTFPNTEASYKAFLQAISRQGFASERKTRIDDPRSACPLSQRYYYELYDNGERKFSLWSATCASNGSSRARSGTVRTLFEKQIPDYNRLVQDVRLST